MVKCEKITEVHAMSVNDLLEQAKQLSPDERRELAQRLLDLEDAPAIGQRTENRC